MELAFTMWLFYFIEILWIPDWVPLYMPVKHNRNSFEIILFPFSGTKNQGQKCQECTTELELCVGSNWEDLLKKDFPSPSYLLLAEWFWVPIFIKRGRERTHKWKMGRRVKQKSFSDIKVWHEGFKPSLKSQSEDQHVNNLMFEF